MKKLNITVTTILLVLGCFLSSPSALEASGPSQPAKFTQIDVPGAILTDANGINPRGDIVGDYVDSDGNEHGFLLSK
jgi:hypothetical protein